MKTTFLNFFAKHFDAAAAASLAAFISVFTYSILQCR